MGRAVAVLLCLVLAACAGATRAPVESRYGEEKTRSKPERHMVAKGETLYSIAWRYGIDYRTLAGINDIAAPYTIYPGQSLALRGTPKPPRATAPRSTAAPTAPPPAAPKPAAPGPAAPKPAAPKPAAPVTKPSSSAVTNSAAAEPTARVGSWQWPTSGKVVRKFSGTVHKGIDIEGRAGDAVTATAAGKVVYAGSGIVGYGKLLIIKHNSVYLSAYGHNRKLLVSEGEMVKPGQRIAEKGSSATNSVKLHFEIRREGNPVDPLKLLPRR